MPKPRGWNGDYGKRFFGKGRPRYVECVRCATEFFTEGRHARYCPECRPEVKRERDREYQAEKRACRADEREFDGWIDSLAVEARVTWARDALAGSVDVDELIEEYGQEALTEWARAVYRQKDTVR